MSALTKPLTNCYKCQNRKFYPNSAVDYCCRGILTFPTTVTCQQYQEVKWPTVSVSAPRPIEGRTVSADEKATPLRYWKLP